MCIKELNQNNFDLDKILETVIAVDIGTSYIKTNEIYFKTTIHESRTNEHHSIINYSIKWNDTFYTIGDSYSAVNIKLTDFKTKEYKLCLLTAIAFSFASKTKSRYLKVRLALGLPAEYYETYYEELISEIKKLGTQSLKIDCQYEDSYEYATNSTYIDDGTKEHIWTDYTIEILDVVIFKHGATLYEDISKRLNFPLTVIDFGSHLVNASNWALDENTPLLINSKTLTNIGFYKMLHDLTLKICSIKGFSYMYNESCVWDILSTYEEGCVKDTTLKEIEVSVLKPYIDKVIYLLKLHEFKINDNILLIGGPSITLLNYVSNKFPYSTISLLDDIDTEFKNSYYPLYGNAFIFFKKYKELLTDLYIKNNYNY
ncbi:hypothetical protein HMPREF1982_01198 [Clostridiales bacterium oral taxon 876 str. F0540]|nr:hypothetical protein HMPREF1982_01198 [Clostridiales bacterium oral taxon 876 str. F0540]